MQNLRDGEERKGSSRVLACEGVEVNEVAYLFSAFGQFSYILERGSKYTEVMGW